MSNKKKDSDINNFGKALRSARNARKVTQESLANSIGISKDYISRIEKGERVPSKIVKTALDDWLDSGQGPSGDLKTNMTSGIETINVHEGVLMTTRVLSSQTGYAQALWANLKSFDEAVSKEARVKELERKIDELHSMQANMEAKHSADMEELKALIKSSGGELLEKKSIAS